MSVFEPEDVIYLELWMIGVIISAVVYGGVLSLTLSYVPLLLKASNDISRRMRNFLLVYVTLMVTFSTVYLITMIVALVHAIFSYPTGQIYSGYYLFQNGRVGAICTTFASWGADGFMLWRCAMLYEGVSRFRRIALFAGLTFMGLVSFCAGMIFLTFPGIIGYTCFLAIIGVTVILNLVTATLITLRILYFHIYIRKTVGLEHNSPYMTILVICVESSVLIIVFSLIFIVLFLGGIDVSYVSMQLLVHIYVLSPLLIVYRVAKGKDATIRQRHENGPVVSELQFQSSAPGNDEV